MRFGKLDLNLLVALDALLTDRSVSLAAGKLCLSQSAVSCALGRLRDYFGDELLILRGRQMLLTARAEELREPVRAVLEQIRTTVAVTPPFDPMVSDRQIRVMASDYITEVLLAPAISQLEDEAPNLRFEIQPMNDNPIEAIDRGRVDLLVTLDYAISSDHPSQILFEDDYVVVGDRNNPAMAQKMTRELYISLGHVTPRFGSSRVSAFEDWFLKRHKQQRRIEVVAPTFMSLPGLIVGTKRLATMHRRMATRLTKGSPLVVQELPFDIPPIREAVQWNLANNNDRALRWFVERLEAIASMEERPAGNVVALRKVRGKSVDELEIEYRLNHHQR